MGALKIFKPTETSKTALCELLRTHKELPRDIANFLAEIAKGDEPTFFFKGSSEFSTQEAADILCVSRPYLIRLLDAKQIYFRMVGKHRRINAASLMAYKTRQDKENKKITDELTSIAEEHGL